MTNHVRAVEAIYAAFSRGDIKEILSMLADDVQWNVDDTTAQREGVPWLQAQRGRAGVTKFFDFIGKWKFNDFRVLSVLGGGNQVAGEITLDADVTQSGGRLREREVHLWTFNDKGQVTRFQHYCDTAAHIAAWRGKR